MKRLKYRQETFCRRFVECANATLAAKGAGYALGSARNAGHRLLRRPEIVSRIAELHREMAHQSCQDVDVLIGKLEAIYRRAIDTQQCSAAARAVELQAKLGSGGHIAGTEAAATGSRRRRSALPTDTGTAMPTVTGTKVPANDDVP